MSKHQWDRTFAATALLFFGGAIGGGFGLVPFLSGKHTKPEARVYVAALVVATVIGVICTLARFAIKSERDDSCEAIKADFDKILGAYDSTN